MYLSLIVKRFVSYKHHDQAQHSRLKKIGLKRYSVLYEITVRVLPDLRGPFALDCCGVTTVLAIPSSKANWLAIRSTDVLVRLTWVGRDCNLVAAVDSISVSSSSGIVSIPSSVTDVFVCEMMSENGNSCTSDNDGLYTPRTTLPSLVTPL